MSRITRKRNRDRKRKALALQFDRMEERQLMTAGPGVEAFYGGCHPFWMEAASSASTIGTPPEIAPASPGDMQQSSSMSTANNDFMSGATNLGTIREKTVVRNGRVGGSDPVDYFKFVPQINGFSLTGKVRTSIQLAKLSADLDIRVLDSSGRIVAQSTRGGTSAENLEVDLNQGQTYFVRVAPYGSVQSSYELTVATGSHNDTLTRASSFGTVRDQTKIKNGRVGGSDKVDYFKFIPQINGFSLTGKINTTIHLSNLIADLDIHVLDSNGNIISRGTRGGTRSENLTLSLNQGGTYYVKVLPYNGAVSSYRLSIAT